MSEVEVTFTEAAEARISTSVKKTEATPPTRIRGARFGDSLPREGGDGLPPAGEQETVLKAVVDNTWGVGFIKSHK